MPNTSEAMIPSTAGPCMAFLRKPALAAQCTFVCVPVTMSPMPKSMTPTRTPLPVMPAFRRFVTPSSPRYHAVSAS